MRSSLKRYEISPFNDGSQCMLRKSSFPARNDERTTMADGDAGVEEQKQIIEGKKGKKLEGR